MSYLLALDQGTSSSRAIVFDTSGNPLAIAQREFTQHYPRPGWVEHDPREIWRTQRDTAQAALRQAGIDASQVLAAGITNQRETTVIWRRDTGEPIHRAIVWQDRRTQPLCARLAADGLADEIRRRTGLVVDPYFSGTKIAWLLEHIPGAREAARRGELAFGTIDSWLAWNLGDGRHVTDVTNAARTLLWNLEEQRWDPWLLQALDIPAELLPDVHPSSHDFGAIRADLLGAAIPLTGIAGDQQAALFGQACFDAGAVKNTYGTGCFMLRHTGSRPEFSDTGLLTTPAAQWQAGQPAYAMEGSVFIGGAVVQWLRDNLHAIETSADVQALAASVPDAGGVTFIPAFTGLGAPYWEPTATGTITGLTRGSTLAHIARAALESIAFQSTALLRAMGGLHTHGVLKVDGGASANDLLMQFQADLLGLPVVRPKVLETTALGAAYLAGLGCGLYRDTNDIAHLWQADRTFVPTLSRSAAEARIAEWEDAVARALGRGAAN
ncbi:MAG: glycerol kinase GlpK [Pigmentiphaga sp.]|nr:glycerol kinase GlpK [Pigmentiphaga sp.]